MGVLAFLARVFLRVLGFLMSVIMVWTVPPSSEKTIAPLDKDSVKLQCALVSDVHMQSFEYSQYRELAKAMRDIARAEQKQDALVFVGDNTMNGQIYEHLMFYGLLSHYNKAKNTLVAMGNHDTADFSPPTYEAGIARHNFFLRAYTGVNTDKDYYSQTINGYTFIILGESDVTPEILSWLDAEMSAAGQGKPIFIFKHTPLYGSSKARAVLEQYDNVFVFNGHWHTPLALDTRNGVRYVNLPALHGDHSSGEGKGSGCQMEVYEDRVVLRGRNYIEGKWMDGKEIDVGLV